MKICFIPTGNVFDLPEKICNALVNDDRSNYKIIHEPKKAPVSNKPVPKEKVIDVKGTKTPTPKKNKEKTN